MPGAISTPMPLPIVTEQPEPAGVIWTMRTLVRGLIVDVDVEAELLGVEAPWPGRCR